MEIKNYPQSDQHLPGTWNSIETPAGLSAIFVCPQCRTLGVLYDHIIADDGAVAPSLVCKCGFHEWIKLEGWQVKS